MLCYPLCVPPPSGVKNILPLSKKQEVESKRAERTSTTELTAANQKWIPHLMVHNRDLMLTQSHILIKQKRNIEMTRGLGQSGKNVSGYPRINTSW